VILDEMPDGDKIRNEAPSAGAQSDEIVIDNDEELEEKPVSPQVSSPGDQCESDNEMEVPREIEAVQRRDGKSSLLLRSFRS